MKKWIWLLAPMSFVLMGCASHLLYTRSATNDVPFERRKPPSGEASIIISTEGPQLDPKYYEILGHTTSRVENVAAIEQHCQDAIKLIRFEADEVGADALINVSCTSGNFNADASGTAISFKNRDEALRVLKQIGARIQ